MEERSAGTGSDIILQRRSFKSFDEQGYFYRIHTTLSHEKHKHEFYEYMLIIKGSYDHMLNGRKERISKGSFILIRPGESHLLEQVGEGPVSIISTGITEEEFVKFTDVYGEVLKRYLFRTEGCETLNLPPEALADIEKDFRALSLQDEEGMLAHLKIITSRLIHFILQHELKERDLFENENRYLKNILGRMMTRENLSEGMPALLRLANMSHGNLCRIIRKETGMTPLQYITKLRMEYAANLLVHTDEDVLAISLTVGYDSLSHFISTFKKASGITPKQYRMAKQKILSKS